MKEANKIIRDDTKQGEVNGKLKETWDEPKTKRGFELIEDEEAERKRARLEAAFEWTHQPDNEQEDDKASSLEGSSNKDEYDNQDIEEWGFDIDDVPKQNLVELPAQTDKNDAQKVRANESIVNDLKNYDPNDLNDENHVLQPIVPLRPLILPDFMDDLDEPGLLIDERVQVDAPANNDFLELLAQYERDTHELLRMVEEFGEENTIELSSSSEDEGEYAKRKHPDPDKPGTSKSSQ
ncbi:hypothetical protein M3Y97_00989500 [Aphelenchoides bicaudatus]|nr:hypothetical protein M3Y97_00989500 [Aphelenchoides bicaudatus]